MITYTAHYSASKALMVSREGFRGFRVPPGEVEAWLIHVRARGHIVNIIN